jgi:hypothetical protein
MLYAEKYPSLNAQFNAGNLNFELVAKVIESNFSDLFDLEVLESLNKSLAAGGAGAGASTKGQYLDLFYQWIINALNCYTEDEIITALSNALQKSGIESLFLKSHVFVPFSKPRAPVAGAGGAAGGAWAGMGGAPAGVGATHGAGAGAFAASVASTFLPWGTTPTATTAAKAVGTTLPSEVKPPKQLGYLEKFMTGSLSTAEPLTYIDMRRAASWMTTSSLGQAHYKVAHIGNFGSLFRSTPEKAGRRDVFFVNFTEDPTKMPKWGVVDLSNLDGPKIYCETPLLETEKRALERSINRSLPAAAYVGGRAAFSISTGYTALAWANDNVKRVCALTTASDFYALVEEFVYIMASCDLAKPSDENNGLFSEAYKVLRTKSSPISIYQLARATILGKLGVSEFAANDLCKGLEEVNKSPAAVDAQIAFNARSFVLVLDAALQDAGYFREADNEVNLTIPDAPDIALVRYRYGENCGKYQVAPAWFDNIKRDKNTSFPSPVDLATAAVLSIFRGRAKKQKLTITLPHAFALSPDEQALIIKFMETNAHVTELVNTTGNPSLQAVHERLKPIFARNRWLAYKDYLPPMADDFWRQAAKYWLRHLNETPDILAQRSQHELFKRCVLEMGLTGLDAVLTVLSDKTQVEYFSKLFGDKKLPFYAACQPSELGPYLAKLLSHLKAPGAYFPFSELGLSYQANPATDDLFINLLSEINHLERFEQIVLTDFLKAQQHLSQGFLQALIRKALAEKWIGLIVIPELEDKSNTSDTYCALRSVYTLLNDVILRNRHGLMAKTTLQTITDRSNFRIDTSTVTPGVGAGAAAAGAGAGAPATATPGAAGVGTGATAAGAGALAAGAGAGALATATAGPGGLGAALGQTELEALARDIPDGTSWPLSNGGSTELQFQQQQQIQQNRQSQQEQQRVHEHREEALVGPLVDYNSIDRLLGDYLATLWRQEQEKTGDTAFTNVDPRYLPLLSTGESALKGFFHTWISANPLVPARKAIRSMTLDAAKMLLRNYRFLSSGLNPDNLPKGFYTQPSKDGDLILCYKPEWDYVNHTPNPLTLNFDVKVPEASAWDGSFRQFNLEKYLAAHTLDADGWQAICLFAHLQPAKDYTSDIEAFCRANPGLTVRLKAQSDKFIQHWPAFLQVWDCYGMAGFDAFLAKDATELQLTATAIRQLLLRNLPGDLQTWCASNLPADMNFLRALGQVYHRYGDKGLGMFLTKLRQIQLGLGDEFFGVFCTNVLQLSANHSCFINEKFFTAMDAMIEKLKPTAAKGALSAWQAIIKLHMSTVVGGDPKHAGWDPIERLWEGYAYFLKELELLGLDLKGGEFDDINFGGRAAAENMLVYMDRLLESLRHIADESLRREFLSNFRLMDRTHGGIHYAVKYERFKYVTPALHLSDFYAGTPTYAPDLQALYHWTAAESSLKIQRTLASQKQLDQEAYHFLMGNLANDDASKDALMWLLHTQYPGKVSETLAQIRALSPEFRSLIAKHIHHAIYNAGVEALTIYLPAMEVLLPRLTMPRMSALFIKYPQGTVLEALSLLARMNRVADAEHLLLLLERGSATDQLSCEGYKLAALFGVNERDRSGLFYTAIKDIPPVVQFELRLLIEQLLSVDFDHAGNHLAALSSPANWQAFLTCIETMKSRPRMTAEIRIAFMKSLTDQGIVFKYSTTGDFRNLTDTDKPEGMRFFVDHEDRLWKFMKAHIVMLRTQDAEDALGPMVRLLNNLQLNRTYINEIEPLLSLLEEVAEHKYWSANYFYELLRALQPEGESLSFPIPLLKAILTEEMIAPKPIEGVITAFPALLKTHLQAIIKNTAFKAEQQALLAQLALREFHWKKAIGLTPQIIEALGAKEYDVGREHVLNRLVKCTTFDELTAAFTECRWLLKHPIAHPHTKKHWTQTAELWLKGMTNQQELKLFGEIKSISLEKRRALILHIVGWSTLNKGLKTEEEHKAQLARKASKLIARIKDMDLSDLQLLASCYPQEPSPTADDILRLYKKSTASDTAPAFSACLEEFLHKPFPEPRSDYGKLALTREADLRRMINETQITGGEGRRSLAPADATRLTLVFSYLKHLQSGEEKVKGSDKSIADMSQAELSEAFKRLSQDSVAHPQDDGLRAQIWAVLFEVLGRTTRKYPHLAQQFALIANDVCVTAPTRILQLATGEGKSHFVAMRAARHAGCGMKVDVCTAKRTLAERDLSDYAAFFDYLGLKTEYIHPKSSKREYEESQICYTTMGDFSLFVDEHSHKGQPIRMKLKERVALYDEFDYMWADEGCKTEYNYALSAGSTPKQMMWFYQEVNRFYDSHKRAFTDGKITKALLLDFAQTLQQAAKDNEERYRVLRPILADKLKLVQWLRSAAEAASLEPDVHYTVKMEDIRIGEQSYPMQSVIPLSGDNQRMIGSTFSKGVHQLLAVRLNTKAKDAGEKQNYYVHPESVIVSSQVADQRMRELWGTWEGFTGTVSSSQARILATDHKTKVLHVPTNQRDLRAWQDPVFFANQKKRIEAIAKQLRACLASKQSILFSCKNDAQVREVKAALYDLLSDNDKTILALEEQCSKLSSRDAQRVTLMAEIARLSALPPDEEAVLTREDYKALMFYTNDDERSAADVLAEKRKQEAWVGGKKQKGICLIASGFGRGDNVEVDAVFLTDVTDTNDKLQKGGRTARNGEEGAVFQFYITDEITREEASISRELAAMGVVSNLDSLMSVTDHKGRFERILLLREYKFNLQNHLKQTHRQIVAKYSSWGMQYLGKITDPTQRDDFVLRFSSTLEAIDKQRIEISGKRLNVSEKITATLTAVQAIAREFAEQYRREVAGVIMADFEPPTVGTCDVHFIPSRAPVQNDAIQNIVSSICNTLASFADLTSDARVGQVPELIERLVTNESELCLFSERMAAYSSVTPFIDDLLMAVGNITPSDAWTALHTSAVSRFTPDTLLTAVSGELKTAFMAVTAKLSNETREQVIKHLCAPRMTTATQRIEQIMPLLAYLGRFSDKQSHDWASEYLKEFDILSAEMPPAELATTLKYAPPLSLRHFRSLSRLAYHHSTDLDGLANLTAHIGRAIERAPEHRIRMLGKWELWAKALSKDEAALFLDHFCSVMMRFEEGKNWDTFVKLVNQTHAWWSKGGKGAYQKELLALWQTFAESPFDLSHIDSIKWSLKAEGKAWFQCLKITLSVEPAIQAKHHEKLAALWSGWDTSGAGRVKKSDKIKRFKGLMDGLNAIYEVINGLEEPEKSRVETTLIGLRGEQYEALLNLALLRDGRLKTYPKVLTIIMESRDFTVVARRIELTGALLLTAAQKDADSIDYLKRALSSAPGLNEPEFAQFVKIIEDNLDLILSDRDVLPSLMSASRTARPPLALDHLGALVRLLSSVHSQEGTVSGGVRYLRPIFSTNMAGLVHVQDKFGGLITLIETNLDTILKNRYLLPLILTFVVDQALTKARSDRLTAILLKAVSQEGIGEPFIMALMEDLNPLRALPDDKFNLMVQFIDTHLIEHRSLHSPLRVLAVHDGITAARVDQLSALFLKISRDGALAHTIDHFKGVFSAQFVSSLPDRKFNLMMELVTTNLAVFARYPQALTDLAGFIGNLVENGTLEARIRAWNEMLLKVIAYTEKVTPPLTFAEARVNLSEPFRAYVANLWLNVPRVQQIDHLIFEWVGWGVPLASIPGIIRILDPMLTAGTDDQLNLLTSLIKGHQDLYVRHNAVLQELVTITRPGDGTTGEPELRIKLWSDILVKTMTHIDASSGSFAECKANLLDPLRTYVVNAALSFARVRQIQDLVFTWVKEGIAVTSIPDKLRMLDPIFNGALNNKFDLLMSLLTKHQDLYMRDPRVLQELVRFISDCPDNERLESRVTLWNEILLQITALSQGAAAHSGFELYNNNLLRPFQSYVINPSINHDRLLKLRNLLLHITEQTKDTRKASNFLGVITAERVAALPDEKFDFVMITAKAHAELFAGYPSALRAFADFITTKSLEESKLWMQAILKIADYHKAYPSVDFDLLLTALMRFQHLPLEHLILINKLLTEMPEHTDALLSTHSIDYLIATSPALRPAVQSVMKLFYTEAKKVDGNAGSLFINLQETFKQAPQKRAILMQMLYQRVFIKDTRFGVYNWDVVKNDKLLGLGFETYVQSTEAVLSEKAPKKSKAGRDLTVAQERTLLKMTDELLFIGRPYVYDGKADVIADLGKDLKTTMAQYSASWFKSRERVGQLKALQRGVEGILATRATTTTRYQQLLDAIQQAKLAAITSDAAQDKKRFIFLNRKGESRYLSTLNKMHDLVLRHWAKDSTVMANFQAVQQHNQREFLALVAALFTRVGGDLERLNNPQNPMRLFSSSKARSELTSLIHMLATFQETFQMGDPCSDPSFKAIQDLRTGLTTKLPQLPGYLVTLANELLARVDGFEEYIKEKRRGQHPGGEHFSTVEAS